jgi:hypothetical protein
MKKLAKSILGTLAIGATIAPSMASAAATSVFAGSSMKAIISGFFKIALVKGIIMAGSIGGGLYLVLSGFGIIGGGQPDPKKIILGGILTGIGLSYASVTAMIASQFA